MKPLNGTTVEKISWKGKYWYFDCIGGTGDRIYSRVEKDVRYHMIMVRLP